MALAQELMDPSGGPSGAYHLAMARLQLQKEQFKDAEESIQEALQYSYQVCLSVLTFIWVCPSAGWSVRPVGRSDSPSVDQLVRNLFFLNANF